MHRLMQLSMPQSDDASLDDVDATVDAILNEKIKSTVEVIKQSICLLHLSMCW